MSDKDKRWPAAEALPVAVEIAAALKPYCSRIVIAGSLRRKKPDVGDIEILYVPKTVDQPVDMFTSAPVSLADAFIATLLERGTIQKRPSKIGSFTWGDFNKFGVHAKSGIPLDLFGTTELNWWVSLVVRTGSKETNLRLTTGAQKLGKSLNAYGCGVTNADGSVTPAVSEEDVFELCGVPYLQPRER